MSKAKYEDVVVAVGEYLDAPLDEAPEYLDDLIEAFDQATKPTVKAVAS